LWNFLKINKIQGLKIFKFIIIIILQNNILDYIILHYILLHYIKLTITTTKTTIILNYTTLH
jgi:hypothetical protein